MEVSQIEIAKYKAEILHIFRDNQVMVVEGEPGIGKTTVMPQYILEENESKK